MAAGSIPVRDAAPVDDAARVRITEIFVSLQGESRSAGWPTVFVRLTGCPLRCQYCDTEYAFTGGEWMSLEAVTDAVAGFGVPHVCVTGGEPLAQKSCLPLLVRLCDAGYAVSIETSGARDVSALDPRVVKVMDLKTPGSGEAERNLYENIEHLTPQDQVKFVICSRDDYEWARGKVAEFDLANRCEVLFSPSFGEIEPRQLADWIVADRLPVRFQMQLHKVLWGEEPGR